MYYVILSNKKPNLGQCRNESCVYKSESLKMRKFCNILFSKVLNLPTILSRYKINKYLYYMTTSRHLINTLCNTWFWFNGRIRPSTEAFPGETSSIYKKKHVTHFCGVKRYESSSIVSLYWRLCDFWTAPLKQKNHV